MLNMSLTETQKEWRDKTRKFVDEEIIPVASKYDVENKFPSDVVEKAKEIGLLDFVVPKEYGGAGLDALSVSLICEELGRGCVAMQMAIGGNGLASYPVFYGGTEEQKHRYYKYILDGKLTAFALTEPGAGSDAGAVATTAVLDGDEYVLNGTKCFITSGGYADIMTLIASTDPSKGTKGLSCFMVELDRKGVTIGKKEDKMGIRASNTVEVILSSVRVPKENLVGAEGKGFRLAMTTLDSARLSVGASALGLAKRVMEETIKFVKKETKGGKPIVASQQVQFQIADMAIMIETAENLIYKTCYLKDAGKPYGKEAAMCKTYCTDIAMKIASMGISIFGPYGYLVEGVVEKLMRDVKIMQIYEGSNEIQRVVIAGNLLRD
ncbi:acyl-CoA dehydrogenase family protein [Bacillus sp. B15-48]|uniref:acyl-CoA dehydrogenase family protein n=1 Tax=Bacillus sp. B15-48 TaxID=1548601 RepID=UPI00193F7583|nr:acyl-CoA dehydrogenase family protein [Bacillus sp. B15-48]MBM4764681.1 acyl-CoA dehydrogenase [Bacillus sp. B15-48]